MRYDLERLELRWEFRAISQFAEKQPAGAKTLELDGRTHAESFFRPGGYFTIIFEPPIFFRPDHPDSLPSVFPVGRDDDSGAKLRSDLVVK